MMHLTMKRENKPLNRIKILLDITHPKKKRILLDIHSKEAYPRNLLKKIQTKLLRESQMYSLPPTS